MKLTDFIKYGTFRNDFESIEEHRHHLANEEHKKTENQKLHALSQLANCIVHDFNNIIAIINGNAELAIQFLPELDTTCARSTKLEKRLRNILKATGFAKGLVEEISDFYKNQMPVKKTVVIGSVVRETLDLLRTSLPHNIEIRERIKDDTGFLKVKAIHIQQVIINLCKNAIQAMRDTGGILSVSLENEAFGINQDKELSFPSSNSIKLTVKDTGHGMTPEETERIFDIYYTHRKDGEGTGLGLTTVHNIVKNYGGMITVSSKPGRGTRVEILLPIEKIE